MATCRDIVRGALKKLGVLGAGQEPSSAEAEDGLASLRSLYQELIVNGGFGPLYDVTTAADMVARPGQRILLTTNSPVPVITLPTLTTDGWSPDDGCDCIWDYGFIRCAPSLLDMAVVTIAHTYDDVTTQSIYDAQTGKWIDISAITPSTTAPLASRGDDGLKALLATRISDEYGAAATLSPLTVAAAGRFQTSIMTRPGSYRPVAVGSYM